MSTDVKMMKAVPEGSRLVDAVSLLGWFIAPALLLALWWVGSANGLISEQILPSPSYVAETAWILFDNGELARNISATMARVLQGFLVGGLLGVAVGAVLGLFRSFEETFGGIFAGLAQVPAIGWVPPLIVLFGIEEAFRITVIALAAFFPIAISVQQRLKGVPESLREVARVFALGPFDRARILYLPSILPGLITGVRLGLSKAMMIVVFVELFAASAGLGFMMDNARRQFEMDVVLIGCATIGLLGFSIDQLIAFAQRRLEA
jgi:sulfonate transport system permease protein